MQGVHRLQPQRIPTSSIVPHPVFASSLCLHNHRLASSGVTREVRVVLLSPSALTPTSQSNTCRQPSKHRWLCSQAVGIEVASCRLQRTYDPVGLYFSQLQNFKWPKSRRRDPRRDPRLRQPRPRRDRDVESRDRDQDRDVGNLFRDETETRPCHVSRRLETETFETESATLDCFTSIQSLIISGIDPAFWICQMIII